MQGQDGAAGQGAARRVTRLALGAGLLLAAAPAAALDFQVHGFAAQGYALSDGNNVVGDSTHGNAQYYEIGLNAAADTGFGLRFAAQELVRKSGETDDGDVRLDYGFLDYEVSGGGGGGLELGVRVGRVKNPFGLFNETRDVVFTRPGILLPSVYFETQGARSLLFASDGGQLYAGWMHGAQYTTLVVTRAIDFDASQDHRRVFFTGSPVTLLGDLRFEDLVVARLMNDWEAGSFRLGLSYIGATLSYVPTPLDPVPMGATLDFHLSMLSARYNAERYSLTAEYQLTHSRGSFGGTAVNARSDGAYVQADYRLTPAWSAMARADASFADRNDRSGDACTTGLGPADRHACYTLAIGGGVSWQPGVNWGVWAEYYRFDGHSQVPAIENIGRTRDPHWGLLLLMAGYRF
jgi:hypothetical protein